MLKNIKSSYFSQIIFSFISEKRKLELFKYNKDIQNKLDITLYDFRQFSQKYIKYETKNKGKEYNFKDDTLIYEGEYLNGEKSKGKEYDCDILIFEGEYLNGQKWNGKGYDKNNNIAYELKNGKGYVKEYKDDKLIFEGEYKYGKRNGKGKEYDYNDNLIFEGEYINGKRNGKGKEYNNNCTIKFEGEYLYNHKIKGKTLINNKLEFEGEFLYDKKWKGKEYDEVSKQKVGK